MKAGSAPRALCNVSFRKQFNKHRTVVIAVNAYLPVVVAVTLCKQAKRHALQQHVAHVHGYLPVGT
jgi:hypothetical protein